jgi:alpha-glucosidase
VSAGWWRQAVGYEVYVRSFADSNGDGIGDLRGLIDHLDHLVDLGVDMVWVTPFYPSPMLDHGYDVADYRDITPEYGTLAEADELIAAVHDRGMRLLIDLVPNHTSSAHPWFLAARSSRDDPHRDHYIWRDPAPDGGPPNNWVSHFGGRAWTLDEATGQYWLHLFLPEQPDLNWRNPAVRDEFDDILRFWLDRGVDGFRIDVAHALIKHADLPDQPRATVPEPADLGSAASDWETLEHPHDTDQPEVLDIYRRWRKIADEYGAMLVGEVYLLERELLARYLAGDGLHASFWFEPLHISFERTDVLRSVLADGVRLDLENPGDIAWVQGSHDRSRAVGRYGGGRLGRERALAISTVMTFLPGLSFLYQGEELGLDDPDLSESDAQDPIAVRAGEFERARDVARTPIPWAPGPHMGFTTGDRAWLPLGRRTDGDTVAVQDRDPGSVLNRYRSLLALHRELRPLPDDFEWLDAGEQVLAFRRGGVVVAANLRDAPAVVHLEGETRFSSVGGTGANRLLAPHEAVVLSRSR